MQKFAQALRGGAAFALPLLLCFGLSVEARAANTNIGDFNASKTAVEEEKAHLDGAAMFLMARPEALDDVAKALNFPTTGSQVTLYGAGATVTKGELRYGLQALLGGLSARQGGLNTEWRLRLGNLVMEQRYPLGPCIFTAGAVFTYGQLDGVLENGNLITRYNGMTLGGGIIAGVRWPRSTPLAFVARGGNLWLPFTGGWKGDQAATNPKANIDMGGPFAQVQVELSL